MTGGVLSLTDNEIGMLKNKHGVVLFHMDGCGHCVNMMPDWNRVVTELKDNIEKFHQHGIKPNVNGFPTVLYFNPSKLHSPEVYNKDRSYEEFKQWIMEKSKKGKSKGKNSSGKNSGSENNNNVLTAIKNYDKQMKRGIRTERFIGNKNEIIVGQEGGGRGRGRRSRRNRVKRLRRTRKHRRTHRRRTHCKSYSKLDVKSGGDCGCSRLF